MKQDVAVELAILGGGPAGYLAAVSAAQLGASVAIVEQAEFGGVCLNRGCIPTKALLRTAEMAMQINRSQELGLPLQAAPLDWLASQKRKDRVVKNLRLGVEQLLQKNAVRIIRGQGRSVNPGELRVETTEGAVSVQCRKLLIATGSQTLRPPIPGLELPAVWTSDEMLAVQRIPRSLAVIGGGAVGLEFAQLFHALGSQVAVFEVAKQLLPQEDGDMAGEVHKALKRQGIKVQLATAVNEICAADVGVKVRYQAGDNTGELAVDTVLLAAGRKPAVPAEILALGAKLSAAGALAVDEHLETSLPGVYAAGDVAGGKMLAHKAYAEGRVAAENALGHSATLNYDAIPSCVYVQPELATVGLGEKAAQENGYEVKTGRFEFRHNGRALCLGEREGLVKVVTDKRTQTILGAQIFGPQATELISELTLAVALQAKAGQIADLIHPHPGLSEAVMEACADAAGRAIHK